MRMYDIIFKKREGYELTEEEISYFVNEYTNGNIPDYQASALLMAIYFKKMTKQETVYLTKAMMNSGEVIDLSAIEGIKVDKHSTGGVGDTTTLVLGPLVASCGVPIAKMSGRGLGHTGGTIDKLESIKGFSTELTKDEFINNVNKFKIAIIGQTKNVAPADKKIYALRDVTATVDNISLIASSIMSKKLAAGSNAIVLDVKMGSGAFMKDIDSAIELAKEMVDIGISMGRKVIAIVTNMDEPLGNAIGNSLEVKEAIETLSNKGPRDLIELCITLASYMVMLGKETINFHEAKKIVVKSLESGKALDKFKEFVKAQNGDIEVLDNHELLPSSKFIYEVKAKNNGYIQKIEADAIGNIAMLLGAGRLNKDTEIDLSAGIILNKKVGDKVIEDETIAKLYHNDNTRLEEAILQIESAIVIGNENLEKQSLIKAIVEKNNIIRL